MVNTWRDPATAPDTGIFLAKFQSRLDKVRIVVLERKKAQNAVIGTAGGMFEWDLGDMLGWHPIPEGLE